MCDKFSKLKVLVQQEFEKFKTEQLYVVRLEHNELFDIYLSEIPEEVRQEYNCNNCKNFLNRFGGIVAIDENNKYRTLWEFEIDGIFETIPESLHKAVSKKLIENLLTYDSNHLGVDKNIQLLEDKTTVTWQHFYLNGKGSTCKVFTAKSKSLIEQSRDSYLGQEKTNKEVYARSLREISVDAIETVIDLIEQGSLYRGNEFLELLQNFLIAKKKYLSIKGKIAQDNFVWKTYKTGGRIRNSVIGSLLVDLSEGRDLDSAVSAFEVKVAPTNYKRPKALITPAMIKTAEARITELGIEQSLYRRHATEKDIPVDEVIYVNRNKPKKGLFEELQSETAVTRKTLSKVEQISLNDFINKVVPKSKKIELLLENSHKNNFMNLIAPVYEDAPNILQWDNKISWSYASGTTDSIKEKVAKAGGTVSGYARISLSWSNYDDLDLHLIEPNGYEIEFTNKGRLSPCRGMLDVDMNAGSGTTREPVENIIYADKNSLAEGLYRVKVHNYQVRETNDIGFTIEVETDGILQQYVYSRAVANKEMVQVVDLHYSRKEGFSIHKEHLHSTVSTIELHNVKTNNFHEVSMIVKSPNFWNKQKGNEHTFFILKNAHVSLPVRGLYNEFLRSDLQQDRKVFEVLGKKLMVEDSEQLAGLGFSATQKNTFICRVEGSFNRTLEVIV